MAAERPESFSATDMRSILHFFGRVAAEIYFFGNIHTGHLALFGRVAADFFFGNTYTGYFAHFGRVAAEIFFLLPTHIRGILHISAA